MQRDRPRLRRRTLFRGQRRSPLRLIGRIALAVAAVPVLYVAAAVAGAVLPRNAGWREPDLGVEVFVRTNGVHSDLVLPANTGGVDWYALARPEHAADPGSADGWIAVGWGQREFYLETEKWSDLRVRTALRAAAGGEALMHVSHGSRPRPSAAYRPLRLEPEGYRQMVAAIDASFSRDARGRAIPLLGRGYADYDVFYQAHGVYHAFRTSNQWTADMLAEGGVEIGIWTPFEQGIMWRFRR